MDTNPKSSGLFINRTRLKGNVPISHPRWRLQAQDSAGTGSQTDRNLLPPNVGPLWSVKGWWTRNVSEIIRIRPELDRSIRNFFFSVSPFPRVCVSLKNGGLINSWICPWAMEENPGHSLSCIIWINCRFGYPRGSSWFRFCTLNVIHIHRNEMWYAQFQLLKLLKPFRKKNLIGLSLMTFILRGSMTSHDRIHTRTV